MTLEGVSLQSDPDYSLIKSCFPYVAKRLVSDDDPRARKALKELIYGAGNAIDVDRLSDLADGFSSYTTTTKTLTKEANGTMVMKNGAIDSNARDRDRKNRLVEAEAAITLAKDSADILLAPEGNLVQNLFLEEGVLVASAQFKDAVREALVDGPRKFRDSLPLGVGSFLPPLPFEVEMEPFIRKTAEEVKAQTLAQRLSKLAPVELQQGIYSGMNATAVQDVLKQLRSMDAEQSALVLKELRENLPKYAPLMTQLGGKFVSTLLKTASMNIEATLSELERAGQQPDLRFKTTAKGLSSAAQRGATVFAKDQSRNLR